VLTYIPYVEEETIDSFNAVGDANFDLYDTAEREHRMEFGPEHEQEEVNKKIDETIERCLTLELDQDQDQGLDERALKMILNAFAKVVDQPVEKLHGRYLHVVKDRAAKSSVVIDVSPADSGEENNDVGVDADVDVDHDARYLKGADSQRNMLCRRCYTAITTVVWRKPVFNSSTSLPFKANAKEQQLEQQQVPKDPKRLPPTLLNM
jgi:hypothetical protein